ncbi:MAG: efflux RND transporter permease subunit [Gemmatimonadetes bacterium]|nr:efflux RND transporter permease subunit [Gemmatimonadota bacterium]
MTGQHDHRPPEPRADEGGERRDLRFLERFQEFRPTSFAVEHRTSMVVLLIIITIMGALSYKTTPKESFPELAIPMIAVSTIYPGVSPADVESQVTRVLEEDLSTISDLKELTSTSVEGYSNIVAEFQTSVNLEDALAKVREKVDLSKPDLPDDAEDPMIIEFNFSEIPVMQVNLAGEYGLVRLKDIGEDLQDKLEQIPQVLRADLRGGLEREVKVDVDLAKLQFYGLSLNDVTDVIRNENVNIPGGSIDVGDTKYLVRVDGEFVDPNVIRDLVVKTKAGRPVYVRDVATVDFGFKERENYARMDGKAVVTLDVVKRSGENVIETAAAVRKVIDEMKSEFPPSTSVSITGDMSDQIQKMVSSLENNIVSGLILIVGILLFFLGLSNSTFVAVSIPSSMFLSFIVLKMMDISMNMVVLFSLILALGMLVDNAIVVVENIYRFMEQGWDRKLAAKKATGEVAVPVIASTATTLAAFTPLLFWPGEVGEFMKYLPITLIVTLTSSLIVALIIVPVLCAMYMKLDDGKPRRPLRPAARWTLVGLAGVLFLVIAGSNPLAAVLLAVTAMGLWALHKYVLDSTGRRFQERVLPAIIAMYERQLRWALDHRAAVIGGTVLAFVLTVAAFIPFNAGIEYFPEGFPPQQLLVDVKAPVGTRASVTDSIVGKLEQDLRSVGGREDWESVVAVTGSGGSQGGGSFMGGGPSGPDEGRITVSLVDFQKRKRDAFATLEEMQRKIGKDIAGAKVSVDKPRMGPQQGKPVNIEIVGDDPGQLKTLSDKVVSILESSAVNPQLVDLQSDMDDSRPELSVEVDREKAALYDLNTSKVGGAIRGAINGVTAAKYRTGNDEYDIVVRLAEPYRRNLESLRDLKVVAENGAQVPLVSVAKWNVEEGYGSIRRKDQTRMATISADVAAGFNSNAVLREVQGTLASFESSALPPGYTMRYTGQTQDQTEAEDFLVGAFLTALMLIGFILISQFNSVVKPVIILTSVMMSTIGVLLGLMIFRMPFGIINTGVGIISLAGVVVNNAIILIDYIDVLRDRDGMNRREALIKGGKTRFRPVVLTATTTALGLVPLAVGLNFDFFGLYGSLNPDIYWGGEQAAWWGPMAVAVIAGILFATFLTLVLVPVMYSLVDDFAAFFARHFKHQEEFEGVASGAGVADATTAFDAEGAYAPAESSVRRGEATRAGGLPPGLAPEPDTP